MKTWLFLANCPADSSPQLRRREMEEERDASGIAETPVMPGAGPIHSVTG
jgi:hypothetical protein